MEMFRNVVTYIASLMTEILVREMDLSLACVLRLVLEIECRTFALFLCLKNFIIERL